MSEQTAQKYSPIFYVHVLVMLFFMFGFGHLPPIYPLEMLGMQVLGIFIALLYAWTFIDFIWPSLLGILALGLTEYDTMVNVFKAGFGNDTFIMVLFMFIWSEFLYQAGTIQYIAHYLVSRKVCLGRPWLFTFMIFLAAYIMGAMISLTATIIIMWSIFYEICFVCGYQKGDKWPAYGLVGIAYCSMLGYAVFPYKVVSALALSSFTAYTGLTVDFGTFVIVSFILSFLAMLLYLVVGKVFIKPDVSLLQSDTDLFLEMRSQKMTPMAKLGASTIILLLIMLLLPEYLSNPLAALFGQLKITGSICLIVLILTVVHIEGRPALDFVKCIRSKTVAWDMLILYVATMPCSAALSSDKTKIMDLVSYYGDSLFSHMGPMMFVIGFTLFAALLTQFAHNLVLAAVLTPIMCNFAIVAGANLTASVIMLCFALGIALATPGASSPGALVYANREWISAKRAYGYGITSVITSVIIIIVIGYPLCLFIS